MKKRLLIVIMLVTCFGLVSCKNDKKYSDEVNSALTALKSHWTDVYKRSEEQGLKVDGYLEIKNTRVICLKESFSKALGHDDILYIVEFIIYTDYFMVSPYYFTNEITVAIFKDGRAEVMDQSLIRQYMINKVYKDVSGFIESIDDLGGEYNTTMKLKF